jgi:hypothetical protein
MFVIIPMFKGVAMVYTYVFLLIRQQSNSAFYVIQCIESFYDTFTGNKYYNHLKQVITIQCVYLHWIQKDTRLYVLNIT